MKKITVILTVIAMLLAAFSLVASAEAAAIGDVHVPYAAKAPKLDGTLSKNEWDTAKKTTFNKNTATVALSTAGTYDDSNFDFYFDMYYAWDEDYLYMAWDMHSSTPWFDYGGNYIRGYFDPKGILKEFCTNSGNVKAKGMPRIVAAVNKDASGIFGGQQLGISNTDFGKGEGGEYGLKLTEYGWTYECKVEWDLFRDSLEALTGKSGLNIDPEAGMKIRANYDCYHINEAKTFKGFLTTYIDQEIDASNAWNFSENANITLILDAKTVKDNPASGDGIVAPAVLCLAAITVSAVIIKKKH